MQSHKKGNEAFSWICPFSKLAKRCFFASTLPTSATNAVCAVEKLGLCLSLSQNQDDSCTHSILGLFFKEKKTCATIELKGSENNCGGELL